MSDLRARQPDHGPACSHVDQIHDVERESSGCVECIEEGTEWVHLRQCLTCGHVGCCNSSEGLHAWHHFKETGHPIMRSLEPGESWRWCWVDDVDV